MTKFNPEKLAAVAKPMPESSAKYLQNLADNAPWLRISMRLAVEIRFQLNEQNITQAELAKRMGVTPAQITKILSGHENLGLKTIARLEQALDCTLISVAGEMPRANDTKPQVITIVVNSQTDTHFGFADGNRLWATESYC